MTTGPMRYFVHPSVTSPIIKTDEQGAVRSFDVFPRAVVTDDDGYGFFRKTVFDFTDKNNVKKYRWYHFLSSPDDMKYHRPEYVLYPGYQIVIGLGLVLLNQQDFRAAFVCSRAGSVIKTGLTVIPSAPIYKDGNASSSREMFAVVRNDSSMKQVIHKDSSFIQIYFQPIDCPRIEIEKDIPNVLVW